MKITNKNNLPQAIVEAVKNDPYNSGDADYSITTLLKPPRMVALERKHADKLEEDASDRIWSLYGQIVHSILERSHTGVGESETRFFASVGKIKVSGQVDFLIGEKAVDYKFITAYKFKNGCPREFEEQLNSYAFLARENGKKISKLELIGLLRDWSKPEARRDSKYPQSQVIVVPVPLWANKEAADFVKKRIIEHESAKKTLPNCSPEERWAKPDIWAIKKIGNEKAIPGGLYSDKDIAFKKLSELKGHEIEYRPGENIRCEAGYCRVSMFCEQFKRTANDKD